MRSVKAAEKLLWERQQSKSYLGGAGDTVFPKLIAPILLGDHAEDERILGLQTPGGCGALALAMQAGGGGQSGGAGAGRAADLAQPCAAGGRRGAGAGDLRLLRPRRADGAVRRDDGGDRATARPGDVVLLQGGCHNPTGADLDAGQWAEVTAAIVERQLLPVVDLAYQGLGRGLEEDAAGLRGVLDACDEVIVAQSCDKNFGVYRDRVGCLFLKTGSVEASKTGDGAMCCRSRAKCGRCRPIMARRWCGSCWRMRRCAPTGGPSWTRCAGGSLRCAQRLAAAHPEPCLHRRPEWHVLDAAADQGAGAQAAQGPCDLHGRQRAVQHPRPGRRRRSTGSSPRCWV